LERLLAEHEHAQQFTSQALGRQNEICEVERERDACRAELNRTLGVKSNLESLCRQLQQQTDALAEERRQLTDMERLRRQELADEFQHTIGDVKTKMDQQANERARLARENEELRNRFKQFFEQYDKREKELREQQRAREQEVQIFENRLAEQAQLYRMEAAKEAQARRENEDLLGTEQALRGQLQTYSNKFNHFQDSLSKSTKCLVNTSAKETKCSEKLKVWKRRTQNFEIATKKG